MKQITKPFIQENDNCSNFIKNKLAMNLTVNQPSIQAILMCAVLVFCLSCSDEWLEVKPTDSITDEAIWTSTENADMFLNQVYKYLPNISGSDYLDLYSDNSDSPRDWQIGLSVHQSGRLNPLDWVMGPDQMWMWGKLHYGHPGNYGRIRMANVFIKKVTESDLPDEFKQKRLAEARFCRAFFYHNLWIVFGGVPIITEPLNNSDGTEIYYPRKTNEETYQFIQSELAAIADELPLTQTGIDLGRATKGAALTLKAFTELVWASPLRNPSNDLGRWKLAANTYKEVIDLGIYGLMDVFDQCWLPEHNNCKEVILNYPANGLNNNWRNSIGPYYVNDRPWGRGMQSPTQELVDAFRMKNGKKITDPGSGYDPQNPYVNREKRFYQTIIYDGAEWLGDTIWTRRGVGSPNEIDVSRSEDYRTNTGYYTKKTVDPRVDANDEWSRENGKTSYIYWRYAEILLGWAEAMNEAYGPSADVLEAVNTVRTRDNDIPTIQEIYGNPDQTKLRELIREERRLETAFESCRFYDVVRWKIADGPTGVLNVPMMGMVIEKVNDTWTYTPTPVYFRKFEPKHYYMSLEQDVIDRNPIIRAQNGGPDKWENGQNPGY